MAGDTVTSAFTAIGRAVVEVDDQDAALAFYRDVLGCAVLHDTLAGDLRYLHVGLPSQPGLGLWLMAGGRAAAGDRPVLVLYTDELDVVRERLSAAGVEVWALRDAADSRSLHFRDPAGNVLIAAQLLSG
jgi:predicted enzyme related to lactoylglutathione lyase